MKVVCATAMLAACAIAAGGADADPYIPGFYTVINYSGAFPDYRKIQGVSLPSELDGVEVDMGWRFNRFYSVEASYSYFNGQKNGNGLDRRQRVDIRRARRRRPAIHDRRGSGRADRRPLRLDRSLPFESGGS